MKAKYSDHVNTTNLSSTATTVPTRKAALIKRTNNLHADLDQLRSARYSQQDNGGLSNTKSPALFQPPKQLTRPARPALLSVRRMRKESQRSSSPIHPMIDSEEMDISPGRDENLGDGNTRHTNDDEPGELVAQSKTCSSTRASSAGRVGRR